MSHIKYSIILPYFERPEQLRASLLSFSLLYANKPLEVVIVDDASTPALRPIVPKGLGFPVTVVTLTTKNGINPCLPYNVGVRHANGEILILSSPETCHVRDIFTSAVWQNFGKSDYLLFQVFAATNPGVNDLFLAAESTNAITKCIQHVLEHEKSLTNPLGYRGYDFSSASGSWYCHPEFRRSGLNFLSAIHRSSYEHLQGFDERFRTGTGFDDLEFRDRLAKRHTFHYSNELIGIHLEHEVVAHKPQFRKPINSNRNLYTWAKIVPRRRGTNWGSGQAVVQIFRP